MIHLKNLALNLVKSQLILQNLSQNPIQTEVLVMTLVQVMVKILGIK
jgi:hypothetical protein